MGKVRVNRPERSVKEGEKVKTDLAKTGLFSIPRKGPGSLII